MEHRQPEGFASIDQLEEALSEPSPGVVRTLAGLEGDILVLGVGGKMGPTLARMARRATDEAGRDRRIIGVSRFSDTALRSRLEYWGVQTIRADLLDRDALASLPDCPNVIYMPGMKFGATGQEALTWAMNTYLAGMVCERYRESRVVAFSTGNVYGMVPVASGGSREADELRPEGEYAMSCLGRERMVEHVSRAHGTRAVLLRLNYAHEMRYGVMVDLARKVVAQEPIDVTMGHFNALWQGDANAMALQALDLVSSPPEVLNLAGPETLSVRRVAEELGGLMDFAVTLVGTEQPDALLSDARRSHALFGYPRVTARRLMEWIAAWVSRGGESLDRPTHFEVRDGKF
ncbi:MAG TPA: NAD-dependent epimerase/dehydratase family protein [Armatimonadota bacterium]|nr:NAD-dependent epimerase/dehydratase family protein [Armatimonadota bacterium]